MPNKPKDIVFLQWTMTVARFRFKAAFAYRNRFRTPTVRIASFVLIIALLAVWIQVSGQSTSNFVHLDKTFHTHADVQHDAHGYVWITALEGMYRYNGYDFEFHEFSKWFGDGFSNEIPIKFAKDHKDNFWVATVNRDLGIIRADGSFLSLKEELKGDRATAFAPTPTAMWIATASGSLYCYGYKEGTLIKRAQMPSFQGRSQNITSMALTAQGRLWLGSLGGVVYGYDSKNGNIDILNEDYESLGEGLTNLVSDKKGRLWIANEAYGLFQYDPATQMLDRFETLPYRSPPLFLTPFCDTAGNIWVCTDGDGLLKIDGETRESTWFRNDIGNPFSISSNTVTDVHEDAHGNLWIVCKRGLVDILPNTARDIRYYNASAEGIPTPALSMLEASDGSIWIGTDGRGLNRVLPDGESVQYSPSGQKANYFPGRYVQKLLEDTRGRIWIATYQNGLYRYDPDTRKFRKIPVTKVSGAVSRDIRYLLQDTQKRIWATSNSGIHLFSEQGKALAVFDYGAEHPSTNISESVSQTDDDTLWVAMNAGGLYRFRENPDALQESDFEKVTYFDEAFSDFNRYGVRFMSRDREKRLWMTTSTGILLSYDTGTGIYESYGRNDALQTLELTSVLVDDSGELWLGSTKGLHRFNPENNSLRSFYRTDGLQGNMFMARSAYKAKDGTLYFGGEYGASAFRPENLEKADITARLHIDQIEVLNKPAAQIVPDQVNGGAHNVESLRLKADQSSFSFRFSAIGNVLKPDFHYAYRLKGFDTDWIYSDNDRVATYTNIPHGDYQFQVRAGTRKGVWDIPPEQMGIYIQPYWWQSNAAYAAYVLLFGLLLTGAYFWVRMRNRLHKEEWQYRQEKELYALKMNFFAKMSHEIKTPLTLILGPIDDMLQKASAKKNKLLKRRLTLIKNNAERLSRISSELLTVRNRELNRLRLRVGEHDIVKDLKRIARSFGEQARFKEIDFVLDLPSDPITIHYDPEKIEHIFYNLLSNAFKFTPRSGNVRLAVEEDADAQKVDISVSDSGPGIPEKELEAIFELFYQSETGKQAKGMGIGLALSKELVDLHHGGIEVASTADQGTVFTVSLSTDASVFSEKELQAATDSLPASVSLEDGLDMLGDELDTEQGRPKAKTRTILIVEDNIELQIFLEELLQERFNVLIAENGKAGFETAQRKHPDIVISDVMMPVMNGIEMSQKLIKKKSTAHIPIILLTAKDTVKSKLKGLRAGAIDYIQKPFNPNELLFKIDNTLRSKAETISKYKKDVISAPQTEEFTSKDEHFLTDLVAELNAQVENSNFKLEELSDSLHMSYSVIFRKCQDITGKTPVEFFRALRLKHAALLIIENQYNISEAAFMVGYKSTKYFGKCFKEEFGRSPSALKKEANEIGIPTFIKRYDIRPSI